MKKQELVLSNEEEQLILNTRAAKIKNKWREKENGSEKISNEVKIIWFDRTYDFAFELLRQKLDAGYEKDPDYLCFEHVMVILGEDVWEHWHK